MWLLYAFIMFLASNVLYLSIRLAQKQQIPINFYTIFMFLVPSIIYFVAAWLTDISLLLSREHFFLVMFGAFFWSYLGNHFSQKALLVAPNPGYSLILQKSYVILTTIAAIFLFEAAFSWQKFAAILVILFFSLFVTSSSKQATLKQQPWVYYSLLTHLCLTLGSLLSKYYLNLGLEPFVYLFYTNLFVATLNSWHFMSSKVFFRPMRQQWLLLIVIGVFGAIFGFTMQLAYKFSPNIGYVAAINVSSIMSLTFLSALFFKDDLSKNKIIGIVGVFVGLLFLVLWKN